MLRFLPKRARFSRLPRLPGDAPRARQHCRADACRLGRGRHGRGGRVAESRGPARVDAIKVDLVYELAKAWPSCRDDTTGPVGVARTLRFDLATEVSDECLGRTLGSGPALSLALRVGMRSRMHVPLVVRGKCVGVLTFGAGESRAKVWCGRRDCGGRPCSAGRDGNRQCAVVRAGSRLAGGPRQFSLAGKSRAQHAADLAAAANRGFCKRAVSKPSTGTG